MRKKRGSWKRPDFVEEKKKPKFVKEAKKRREGKQRSKVAYIRTAPSSNGMLGYQGLQQTWTGEF